MRSSACTRITSVSTLKNRPSCRCERERPGLHLEGAWPPEAAVRRRRPSGEPGRSELCRARIGTRAARSPGPGAARSAAQGAPPAPTGPVAGRDVEPGRAVPGDPFPGNLGVGLFGDQSQTAGGELDDGAREGEWRQAVALLGDRHSIRLGNEAPHRVLGALRLADEIMLEFEVARLEPVDGTGQPPDSMPRAGRAPGRLLWGHG